MQDLLSRSLMQMDKWSLDLHERGARVNLSYDQVAEILKIIDSSSSDEIIIEIGGVKLIVRRNDVAQRGSP